VKTPEKSLKRDYHTFQMFQRFIRIRSLTSLNAENFETVNACAHRFILQTDFAENFVTAKKARSLALFKRAFSSAYASNASE
jgi:hypothetical protein